MQLESETSTIVDLAERDEMLEDLGEGPLFRMVRSASGQIDSGADDPAFDAVSRFAAAAQTARTSASRLTA